MVGSPRKDWRNYYRNGQWSGKVQNHQQIAGGPKVEQGFSVQRTRNTMDASAKKSKGDDIPVEIRDDGNPTTIEEETEDKDAEITFEEEPQLLSRPSTSGYKGAGTKEFHVKKPMVQKYGYIEGCPACQKLRSKSKAVDHGREDWVRTIQLNASNVSCQK